MQSDRIEAKKIQHLLSNVSPEIFQQSHRAVSVHHAFVDPRMLLKMPFFSPFGSSKAIYILPFTLDRQVHRGVLQMERLPPHIQTQVFRRRTFGAMSAYLLAVLRPKQFKKGFPRAITPMCRLINHLCRSHYLWEWTRSQRFYMTVGRNEPMITHLYMMHTSPLLLSDAYQPETSYLYIQMGA